jgi:hypothetical protein
VNLGNKLIDPCEAETAHISYVVVFYIFLFSGPVSAFIIVLNNKNNAHSNNNNWLREPKRGSLLPRCSFQHSQSNDLKNRYPRTSLLPTKPVREARSEPSIRPFPVTA